MIDKYCVNTDSEYFIDIGCGPGAFTKIMTENYKVVGLDTSPIALEYAKKRGLNDLFNGTLENFPSENYNIKGALMLDVVEHIEDDKKILSEVSKILPAGGWFVATVPAYQWLWSQHDVKHMHYRRYTKKAFKKLVEDAGFEIKFSSYFNTFLFPLASVKRFFENLTDKKDDTSGIDEVSPFINKIFKKVFLAERYFLNRMSFPFGVSIILLAQKKA